MNKKITCAKYVLYWLYYICSSQVHVFDMLKANEQVAKRERISKMSEQDLLDITTSGLKRLASGLIPGYSKMKKAELVVELLEVTKAERIVSEIIPDTPLDVIETNSLKTQEVSQTINEDLALWTGSLYKEFRSLVQSKQNSDGTWNLEELQLDISGLAYRVVHFLNTREGFQDDGGIAFTTKLRYRTRICNLLEDLVESESQSIYYPKLKSCLDMMLRGIKIQINDLTQQKKGLQERNLAARKKEKEAISFTPLYSFAVNTLNNLDSLSSRRWKNVSIALSTVTGRRMAEIHNKPTSFEYVDKNHVSFFGQLKVKGDAEEYFSENPAYNIPVLVDASLVVKAHQWLRDNGKIADSPAKANRKYSSDLSDAMKGYRHRMKIKHKLFSYKALRTVYAQVCNLILNPDPNDNVLYLAEILGHGRGELLKGDNLTDMLTPQSYNSDFIITDVDCVDISFK